jgi:hypothetical protein
MSSDGYRERYYVAKLDGKYLHIDRNANQHTQGPAWIWGGLIGAAKINPEYFNEDSNPYKQMWYSMNLSEAELVQVYEDRCVYEEEEE